MKNKHSVCIALLVLFLCMQRITAQIAFIPPSIPMWDTWIFEEEGVYNLFYLSGGNIGRAKSFDMIHWSALPSIKIDSKKGDWDEGGARMTGCTVKLGNNYYITYGASLNNPGTNVGLLISKDMETWKRYEKNPIVSPQTPYKSDTDHFRDLVSFYDTDKNVWDGYMFGLHKETNRPSIAHLTSKNYKKWDFHEPIFISEDYTRYNDGFVFLEVPDYFQMGDKHYLVFSSVRSRKEFTSGRKDASGTWYIVADKKEGPYLVPEEPLLLGYGNGRKDTYVGHTVMYKAQRLLYHHTWGEGGKVCLGTPKLVHQNIDGTLELRFWKDLEKLQDKLLFENQEITFKVSKEESRKWEQLKDINAKDFVISCKVNLGKTQKAGITWHVEENKSKGIVFYPEKNKITIGEIQYTNELYANSIKNNILDDFTKENFLNGEFDLRIMSREHMVEVYVNDKLIFATSMIGSPQEGGIGYWSEEGEMIINNLSIFKMETMQ